MTEAVTEKCACGATIVYAGNATMSVLQAWRRDHRHDVASPLTRALDGDHPQAYTYRHECDLPIMLDLAWDAMNPPEAHCGECGKDWTYGVIDPRHTAGRRVCGWMAVPETAMT